MLYIVIFNFLSGLASFIGLYYSAIDGITLYLLSGISTAYCVSAIILWHLNQKKDQTRIVAQSYILSKMGKVNADSSSLLVSISRNKLITKNVVDIIRELLKVKKDPTERYWLYMALVDIDDKNSRKIIKRAQTHEEYPFAREALKLKNKPK